MTKFNKNFAVYPSYILRRSGNGSWWPPRLRGLCFVLLVTSFLKMLVRWFFIHFLFTPSQNEDTKGFPFNRPGMLTAPRVTTHPFHDWLMQWTNKLHHTVSSPSRSRCIPTCVSSPMIQMRFFVTSLVIYDWSPDDTLTIEGIQETPHACIPFSFVWCNNQLICVFFFLDKCWFFFYSSWSC